MALITYIIASILAGSVAGFSIDDWKINFSSMLREKKNEQLLKKRERAKELLDAGLQISTRRIGVLKITGPKLVATSPPSGYRRSYVRIKSTVASSVLDDVDSRASIVD